MLNEDLYILIEQNLVPQPDDRTDNYRLVHVQLSMERLDDVIERRLAPLDDGIIYVWRYSTEAELTLATVAAKQNPLHRALNYSRWSGRRQSVHVMNGMVIGSALLQRGKNEERKYATWSVDDLPPNEFTPVVAPYRKGSEEHLADILDRNHDKSSV